MTILGGGTAGWMTAAALAKALPQLAITLVESEVIGTIGVGEATIPTIHWYNRLIGLDEATFMAATGATYKLGIEFVGWQGAGTRYFHPFGTYGGPGDGAGFPQKLVRGWLHGLHGAAEEFSLTAAIAAAGRFAKPINDPRSLLSTLGYAFHFDAGRYAAHLRGIAEAAGVSRVEGQVIAVRRNTRGFVADLHLEDGRTFGGDLFVDCSGLRGRLIADEMGAGFTSWARWLPCDAAWAVPTAPEPAGRTPFTRATADHAGWRWRIPLRHRTGNGYVFATDYEAPPAACDRLLAGLDAPPTADPRLIRFTPGCRQRMWLGNVVAIGLAAGFLEPLESTSIHLIQSGIGKLLSLFPDQDCSPTLAVRFDQLMAREMEEVRDFLIMHYLLTTGRTEPLWGAVQVTPPPDTLLAKLDAFRGSGRLLLETDELFRDASWFAVLSGQGVSATANPPLLDSVEPAALLVQLEAVRTAVRQSARKLPNLTYSAG